MTGKPAQMIFFNSISVHPSDLISTEPPVHAAREWRSELFRPLAVNSLIIK
jgi:hypothetical protein